VISIGIPVRHVARLLLVRVRGSVPRPEPGGEVTYRTSPYTHSRNFVCNILHKDSSERRPVSVRRNSAGSALRDENDPEGCCVSEVRPADETFRVLSAKPVFVPSRLM
jgi:hypothetical protein